MKKFIDFDENGDGVLTLEEFKELMKSLEGVPSNQMSGERVLTLFKEALELSNQIMDEGPSDKISPECFVQTIVKNKIGGYGNEFLDFEFLQ